MLIDSRAILSESCLAREGGCLFSPCGQQEAAAYLSQTRIFHILTLNGVLGIVPQLVISAITGYCFRVFSTFSSDLTLNIWIGHKRRGGGGEVKKGLGTRGGEVVKEGGGAMRVAKSAV